MIKKFNNFINEAVTAKTYQLNYLEINDEGRVKKYSKGLYDFITTPEEAVAFAFMIQELGADFVKGLSPRNMGQIFDAFYKKSRWERHTEGASEYENLLNSYYEEYDAQPLPYKGYTTFIDTEFFLNNEDGGGRVLGYIKNLRDGSAFWLDEDTYGDFLSEDNDDF